MLYTDRQSAINLLLLLTRNFELYFMNGCINSLIGPGLIFDLWTNFHISGVSRVIFHTYHSI